MCQSFHEFHSCFIPIILNVERFRLLQLEILLVEQGCHESYQGGDLVRWDGVVGGGFLEVGVGGDALDFVHHLYACVEKIRLGYFDAI